MGPVGGRGKPTGPNDSGSRSVEPTVTSPADLLPAGQTALARALLAVLASGLVHVGLWWWTAGLQFGLPDVEVDLVFEGEATFGGAVDLPDEAAGRGRGQDVDPPDPPTPTTSAAAGPDTTPAEETRRTPVDAGIQAMDGGLPDARPVDAAAPEAGEPDGGPPADAAAWPDGGPLEAGAPDARPTDAAPPDGDGGDAGVEPTRGPSRTDAAVDAGRRGRSDAATEGGTTRPPVASRTVRDEQLPPGSQIALRVAFERLRGHPLAPEVSALLAAIPEWREALRGSGVAPLDDLDQVLVAHPGATLPGGWPDPSRFAIAGAYRHGDGALAQVAERMARQREQPLRRRRLAGHEALRWWDDSGHERWVVPFPGGRFLLAARRDLPALLAMAARAPSPEEGSDPFAAWLAPPGDALLSLQAEGLRRFARRGGRYVPDHLRLVVQEPQPGRYEVRLAARYEGAETASEAHRFWDAVRSRYVRNVFVQLLGLAPLLQRLELQVDEAQVLGQLRLSEAEARRLLRQLRAMLPRRPPPGAGTRHDRPRHDTQRPAHGKQGPGNEEGARPEGRTPPVSSAGRTPR